MMIILYAFLLLYTVWLFFLAIMNLKRVRDNGELGRVATAFAWPLFIIGYALDVLGNIFPVSFLFLELPREWTISARLKRLTTGDDWRAKLAIWFASNLLEKFDPSGHHVL